MSCMYFAGSHITGFSLCHPLLSISWVKYPLRLTSVTATSGSFRSAADLMVSPARIPRPPLYVGMSFLTPISMEKYAIMGSAVNSCRLFIALLQNQKNRDEMLTADT